MYAASAAPHVEFVSLRDLHVRTRCMCAEGAAAVLCFVANSVNLASLVKVHCQGKQHDERTSRLDENILEYPHLRKKLAPILLTCARILNIYLAICKQLSAWLPRL